MRFLWVFLWFLGFSANLMGQQPVAPYDHQHFIVKIKTPSSLERSLKGKAFRGVTSSKWRPLLSSQYMSRQKSSSVLDGVYKVTLDQPVPDLLERIEQLKSDPEVVYAEPIFYDYPLRIPNDPLANPNSGSQYYLNLINAYDAWDISRSNSDIRIAILDTGIDSNHDDLGNRWINEAEPVNGIDDDGNGRIDDFSGWDFADNDNDPTADFSDHGLRVTGVSNSEVDNAVGLAGVGYNASYVPVKVFSSESGISANAYEGIIYAAEQGFEIINLSWGSPNSFAQHRQDIINFATLERGAVVVAAAGNTPQELDFYPASYNHVLSVASTDENDQKSDFSTFSYNVDLTAPGSNIVSTEANNGYRSSSGTSFATPQVAGAAALLMSLQPTWSNFQIMEQLRVTTDSIDQLAGNTEFAARLGSGRLNILKALTAQNTKSARITDFSYGNGIGSYAYFGDTVEVTLTVDNYLSAIDDLSISVGNSDSFVDLIDSEVTIGHFDSLGVTNHSFQLLLSDDAPNDQQVLLEFDYSGTDYTDRQFLAFQTNPDRLDFGVGRSFLTTNSEIEIGHETNITQNGIGFWWDGRRLLESIGLMVATSPTAVVNNAMNDLTTLSRDNDFEISNRLKLYRHPAADLFASGDIVADNNPALQLDITHQYYAWSEGTGTSDIVLEFRVTNTSAEDYEDVNLGLFANWDLNTVVSNISGWNEEDSIAFVSDATGTVFSGMASLQGGELMLNYNSVDVTARVDGFESAFNDAEKYEQLSVFNGDSLIGTDVIQTLAVKVPALAAQQSVKIAFVLTAANSYEEVRTQIEQAKERYVREVLPNPRITNFATTCEGGDVLLQPDGSDDLGFTMIRSG